MRQRGAKGRKVKWSIEKGGTPAMRHDLLYSCKKQATDRAWIFLAGHVKRET